MSAAAWWALALLHVVPGVLAVVSPGAFAADLAGLATDEVHYVRDVGVGELTLAALATVAALRPALSRPLAAVFALQLVLHAGSHAVDGLGGAVVPLLVLQGLLIIVTVRAAPAGAPPAATRR